MASYMILSALSGKGPLSREVTNAALTALVCKPCQGGMEPSLLCALAIAQVRPDDHDSLTVAFALASASGVVV